MGKSRGDELAIFDIDGGEICYDEHGGGDPPLVLVHGLACALGDWDRQVKHFAPSRRVVCLDQRGHGQSRGHTSGFEITTYGADLAALTSALRLPPALLVGHSMGCKVILECARAFPELVAGLVLIDGSRLAAGSTDAALRAAQCAIRDPGYEAFVERLFSQMFTASSDPGVRDEIVARAKRLPRSVGLELIPAMAAWDAGFAEDALRSVKVPVKALQSTYLNENRERISLQPGGASPWLELIKEIAPHVDIQIISGVGHFTMIEAAESVNRHIEAVLENLDC